MEISRDTIHEKGFLRRIHGQGIQISIVDENFNDNMGKVEVVNLKTLETWEGESNHRISEPFQR